MFRKIGAIGASIFAVSGIGFGVALAASGDTTGTNVSCATATVSTPDHTVGVDGTDVHTITGDTSTASHCETATYTIPTNTATTTQTVTQTVTSTPTSTTTPTSSTSSSTTTSSTSSGPPPPPAGCTVVLSALTNVNADLTSGSTVCLAAGSYGSLNITAKPTSNATLTANTGAHVSIAGVTLSGQNITLSQIHSTGGITVNSGNNYVIDHNDVTNASGYGIAVLAPLATPSTGDVISGNMIHNTSTTGEGDGTRFDGVKNLTVTGNDIYNINDCPPPYCHTDTMQFYNANVAVSGVTISKNYIHDNEAQGVPFLKDADYSNVSITDNLELRMPGVGQVTGMTIQENTTGLVIRNNTYWGTSGSAATAGGSSANPSILLDHNVFDQFNEGTPKYPLTDSHNVFGQAPWSFTMNSTDRAIASPPFMNTATDDYRLVGYNDSTSPNNGIGIDWSPQAQSYGPSN